MPLCEYTGNALWTLGVGVGRANRGVSQLAVPSGWAELAVRASRPVGP